MFGESIKSPLFRLIGEPSFGKDNFNSVVDKTFSETSILPLLLWDEGDTCIII